ncbi:hypothetical protein JCM14469_00240 [Desulfatiferula olefinivorans]
MKKILLFALAVLLVLPALSLAKRPHNQDDCRIIATVFNDGTGDNRTKKRGGNYTAVDLKTLNSGDILTVNPVSGTYKYVTLHARFQGGYWRTLYQGDKRHFPVDEYLAASKNDPQCTHVNISVNGAHEKYEPVACTAEIKVCRKAPPTPTGDCKIIATVFNDGTGDNRTKKRGGNYAAVDLKTLNSGDILNVNPVSGTYRYVTLHARFQGGYWRTLYQGDKRDFPVDEYLAASKNDPQCTHVNISVNGAHEKYEPVACTAEIKICREGTVPAVTPPPTPAGIDEKRRSGNRVALKVHNGQYVSAVNGGGSFLRANQFEIGEFETFILETRGPDTVALKAAGGQYVCAEGYGIVVNRPAAGPWETFTLVRLGGDNVALKAHTGRYVCALNGGGRELVADRSDLGPWETFTLVSMNEASASGEDECRKVATVVNDGTGDNRTKKRGGNYTAIDLTTLSSGDVLTVHPVSGTYKYVTLHARFKGGYWRTLYQGDRRDFPVDEYLAVSKNDPQCTHVNLSVNGAHEKYEPLACTAEIRVCRRGKGPAALTPPVPPKQDRNRRVALKTYNGRYITALNGGGSFLMGTASTVGPHETFTLIRLPGDKQVALRAASGHYVCAEGNAVVVNRTKRGDWETFTLVPRGTPDKVAFKNHTGNHICAENGGNSTVVANRPVAAEWETFTLIDAD